jgi:hypothetical protein
VKVVSFHPAASAPAMTGGWQIEPPPVPLELEVLEALEELEALAPPIPVDPLELDEL